MYASHERYCGKLELGYFPPTIWGQYVYVAQLEGPAVDSSVRHNGCLCYFWIRSANTTFSVEFMN